MAKKRSPSRKGAKSRKKASASRKRPGAKKAAPRKRLRAAAAPPIVPRRNGKIDFSDLKGRLKAHEEELRKIENPDEQVQSAIRTLERTRFEMSSICGSTMTIP